MDQFFASNAPAWSNKEVIVAFGSAVALLIPTLISLYKIIFAGLRHQVSSLRQEVHALKGQLMAVPETHERLKSQLEDATSQIDQFLDERDRLTREMGRAQANSAEQMNISENHRAEAAKLGKDLESIEGQYNRQRHRIRRAIKADGFTWTGRVLANAPAFRPLEQRQMPIISILNLKGGVGKTTMTANLGASLSRRGWKVLLIDLDLQGSLTNLFMTEQEQSGKEADRRFIGDFFARAFDAEFPNLLDYRYPVQGANGSSLVGTVDTLAYAESKLTIRWLLREGRRDPRFILRRELHLMRISNAFDIVLIDCPPLINVSCVNALAASDAVLIPVMPSKPAIERVPVLLKRMHQFRQSINPNLKALGMVANRTRGFELTYDEKNRLTDLRVKARDTWGEDVALLDAFIPQSVDLRTAEDEHRPLAEGERTAEAFRRLAVEVETRLPTFCRPSSIPPAVVNEVSR